MIFTFPDGKKRTYPFKSCGAKIAASINPKLAKNALGLAVDGMLYDLNTPLEAGGAITFLTWPNPTAKQIFWHSTAHLLAQALVALYPGIYLGIGPPIARGFYYDVDFRSHAFDASHLPALEKKIKELAQAAQPFSRRLVSHQAAVAYFTQHENPYKLELLEELVNEQLTFYQQGNFIDLCKGPHLPHSGYIKEVKLTSIAGAYWRGKSNRKQLTRIYGISFPKASLLAEHLTFVEEAKKRDHRKIGKDLGLFTFSKAVGLGLPLWLPKGALLRKSLIDHMEQAQLQAGYQIVSTPHIGDKTLYTQSGHLQKYGKDTFQPITTPQTGEAFLLKPMNCPHHCELYKAEPRSYKCLPLRFAEFGTVYRYEQHGELHGLTRTRGFTQDDAHIFCTPDQVEREFCQVIDLVLKVLKRFDFRNYHAQLSLRDPSKPSDYLGDPVEWKNAEKALKAAVINKGLKTKIVYGEAAFYGPKLDFMVDDALGRSWQLGTIQLDYQLPARFELTYVDNNNTQQTPVLIHRAPFGSLERFIALLLEHTGGKLPLWLAPQQIVVLPLGADFIPYAKKVAQRLSELNFRVEVDPRDEKVGRKIRDAENTKIPYMLIVGEREQRTGSVAVRKQSEGNQGSFALESFAKQLQQVLLS